MESNGMLSQKAYSKTVDAILAGCILVFALTIAYFIGLNLDHVMKHRVDSNFHYDFGFFYYAFHVIWHHQSLAMLYNQSLQQHWMASIGYPTYISNQYVYPPQFAVLFCWLAAFPYQTASFIWFALALCSYGISIYLLIRMTFERRRPLSRNVPLGSPGSPDGESGLRGNAFSRGRARTLALVFVILLCLSNDGFYSDITIGNVTWLLLTLLSVALYLRHIRQKPIVAGVLLGVAVVIKITPAILLLYYAAKRDWKMIWGIFIGIASTTLLTVLVVGWRIVWEFGVDFQQLLHSSLQNGPAPFNLSMKGILLWIQNSAHLHLRPSVEFLFISYLALVGLMVLSLVKRRVVASARADGTVAALCLILFSPLVEGTHLLLLVITSVMVFSLWWDDHSGLVASPEDRFQAKQGVLSMIWFLLYVLSVLLLSTLRELFEAITHGFPFLALGYWLLTISAVLLLYSRKLKPWRRMRC